LPERNTKSRNQKREDIRTNHKPGESFYKVMCVWESQGKMEKCSPINKPQDTSGCLIKAKTQDIGKITDL
jgi:hypothetical protein